ncbi:RNA methyltransferase [Phenylobacterium sp.]|uniref:RNA methyltransferase n=1 Tax=Phenylobacterium sp. TaxID=1871053 RepID=UPI002BB983FC|nr:RNA methyltransferase [Phenylobacterium sp.]HLZ74801.1 RNA methyltransferase [Phenylobacterium sp.]
MAAEGLAVILCEPQLGENIGAVARAMLNCGLTDLRLVDPRDGWPSEPARAAAAGADVVIDGARVFDTVEAAIADLHHVYATTARLRDMVKPVLSPDKAADRMIAEMAQGGRCGVLFGRERSGLTNDQVALADAAVTFPLNPGFTSLNLAQAVLLIGWEWRKRTAEPMPDEIVPAISTPATHGDMVHLFAHLEAELETGGFFHPPERRGHTIRNLRNLLTRANLTEQDVKTLHGVVAALVQSRKRGGGA